MKKKQRGLRIGRIRIKPLGLIVLILLVLLIAACVVLFAGKPFEVGGGGFLSPTATPSPTPEPTPTPSPSPTPEPTPRSATIRSLGEIAMQDNLLKAAQTGDGGYDFSPMFSQISSVMGAADYTVADVEGSLGGTKDASGGDKLITPPSLIQTLADCGVDMLNLANDHALDGGWPDLQATLENCKSAGMEYVGAAGTLLERDAAKVIDINGIRVGFVSYTQAVGVKQNKNNKDAFDFGLCLASKSKPKTDIQACRDAGADVVVAYASWGKMFSRKTTKQQQAMAKQLVQAGADVIIGYNPHVIQPARWMELKDKSGNVTKRTLCMLSNGNFLSDSREKYRDSGVIFQFTIQEREDLSGFDIVNPVYIPTYVWRSEGKIGEAAAAEGEAAEENSKAAEQNYDYRTLAVGQWLETAPEGMNYTQESRMREVWAEAQSVMGTNVATVANQ